MESQDILDFGRFWNLNSDYQRGLTGVAGTRGLRDWRGLGRLSHCGTNLEFQDSEDPLSPWELHL